MDGKTMEAVRECLNAIGELAVAAADNYWLSAKEPPTGPIRVLLDHVDELVSGKATTREKKNAGDRARRSSKKSAKKRTRVKRTPAAANGRSPNAPAVG